MYTYIYIYMICIHIDIDMQIGATAYIQMSVYASYCLARSECEELLQNRNKGKTCFELHIAV